jgi:hypothetical protein
MMLGFRIEFVTSDKYFQEIPWVQVTDRVNGEQRVYRSDGLGPDDPPPDGARRVVDCMDCHNRPTHIFRSPDRAANYALAINPALPSLPFAKREIVQAVVQPYETREAGEAGVKSAIQRFYDGNYPDLAVSRKADVQLLANATADIYANNFFPAMKVTWRVYPDNIGHKIFPGCFRCHDGQHVDGGGEALTTECSACHDFIVGTGALEADGTVRIGDFEHSMPLDAVHTALRCDRCHTGGVSPLPTCEGCHTSVAGFRDGSLEAFSEFGIEADVKESFDCEDCHDLSRLDQTASVREKCVDCHDDEDFGATFDDWLREADESLRRAEAEAGPETRRLLNLLREAGPTHNLEATRLIIEELTGFAAGAE